MRIKQHNFFFSKENMIKLFIDMKNQYNVKKKKLKMQKKKW